ncbi:MAG: histidine phosphatase family protein [Alphaproteobacteria bacterium]|nr:histidine phosphatase family protein [Alphaproteobacteria bacterium]
MPLPRSFYFLRHGETDWNRALRVQGWTDIPLNDTGRAQAGTAIAHLRGLDIDHIVASPLVRAKETADIVNTALDLPIITDADLRERHFGQLEGAPAEDFKAFVAKGQCISELCEENGYPCPEGGESYADFKARVLSSMTRHLENFAGKNVLFVAHGGLYRVLCRAIATVPLTHSPNAAPFRFEKAAGRWQLYDLAEKLYKSA